MLTQIFMCAKERQEFSFSSDGEMKTQVIGDDHFTFDTDTGAMRVKYLEGVPYRYEVQHYDPQGWYTILDAILIEVSGVSTPSHMASRLYINEPGNFAIVSSGGAKTGVCYRGS